MKKITFVLIAASLLLVGACGNQQNKKKAETKATTADQYLKADLKIQLDSLVAELMKLKSGIITNSIENGKITLTEKEKKVKPNYLMPLEKAQEAATLSEKYRAVAIYMSDMAVAQMYDMPTDGYKQTITKLLADINSPVLTASFKDGESVNIDAALKDLYDECMKNSTMNLFWDIVVSSMVEQLYIVTQNTDKFITCFDDKSAADVTYRFVLVHNGITSLIPYHPEMKNLETILKPLEVINAMSVSELRDQLLELKGSISTSRGELL